MTYLCTITTPIDGPSATLCPQCKRILPDAEFKRLLTPAQARARGFTLPGERVYATWSKCKDCDPPPQRKSLRTMTSHQIYQAIMNDEVRISVAEAYMEKARKRENEARAKGPMQRWAQEWANRWHFAREKLRAELRATTLRLQYLNRNPPAQPEAAEMATALLEMYRPLLRHLIEWTSVQAKNRAGREYLRRAQMAADRAQGNYSSTFARRPGRPAKTINPDHRTMIMDKHSEWADYASRREVDALRQAWAALARSYPDLLRTRLPVPLLLTQDEERRCLHGFVPAQTTSEDDRARMQAALGLAPVVRPTAGLAKRGRPPAPPPAPQPDCIDHGCKGIRGGYATIAIGARQYLRHRVAYGKHHGLALDEIPPIVRHTCGNKRCVNPEHLVEGTRAEVLAGKRGKPKRAGVNLSPDQKDQIRQLREQGVLRRTIARSFGVTVHDIDDVVGE